LLNEWFAVGVAERFPIHRLFWQVPDSTSLVPYCSKQELIKPAIPTHKSRHLILTQVLVLFKEQLHFYLGRDTT
jgi:hypothetical protein